MVTHMNDRDARNAEHKRQAADARAQSTFTPHVSRDLGPEPESWRMRPRWDARPERERGLDTQPPAPQPDWRAIDARIDERIEAARRKQRKRIDEISARTDESDRVILDAMSGINDAITRIDERIDKLEALLRQRATLDETAPTAPKLRAIN